MRLKAGQVKKPLALAVGLGLVAGAMSVFSDYYLLADTKLYLSGDATRWEVHNFLSYASVILGLLVFPAVVGYMARRFYFLWSIVPAFLTVAAEQIFVLLRSTYYGAYPQGAVLILVVSIGIRMLIMAVAAALISSGPVSLIRYIIQRRRGTANGTGDLPSVERDAKEGAWPPAPKSSQSK